MLQVKGLSKIFNQGKYNEVKALGSLDLVLPDKGMVFLVGESGSGKTTLLNILSSIEKPSGGEIIVDGVNLSTAKGKVLNNYRNKEIGIIFQNYNLLQDETVESNIKLALELQGRTKFAKVKLQEVLQKVGLNGYADRKITQLSGGQQQRVAIARALIKSPKIIFADEPTGNLDSETSESIMELFKELSDNRLVVIVCHDMDLANTYADRIITLKDGSIEKDEIINGKEKDTENWFVREEKKKAKHLPFARQLKFAFKNLWAIKFRLIVVIFMLGISIAAAGVGAITSRYDREDTRARAYSNSGLSSLLIREQEIYEVDEYGNPIEQTGFMKQKLMDESKIEGFEEISDGEYYRIYGTSDAKFETLVVTGDFTRLEEFGFKVIMGRYPKKAGEVAVSMSWAENRTVNDSYSIYGDSIEDVLGEKGIVGIIDFDETLLTNVAKKVYDGSGQKELLTQMYINKESERGRTKFMFVMEEDMDKYRENFNVHNRVERHYVYKDKDKTESPYYGWNYLRYDMPEEELGWHRGFEWADANCLQMKDLNDLIQKNEVWNYDYIGKNPDEMEEDEIVLTCFNYNQRDNRFLLDESDMLCIVVNAIQQEKGIDYNVSREELLDYIANNDIECEIQFHTYNDPEVYSASNTVVVNKKFKITGMVFADASEDVYNSLPLDFKYQFVYSDKLDMLKVAFNNYGLIGYVANIGSDLEKDRQLLDYCEANDLDYNGIMAPYLQDADERAQYLQKISAVLTVVFAFISVIVLTNLTLLCMQKTKKQTGLLRSLGSGAADNVGIYLLQGAICGIIVAILAMVFFPIAVNICASGSGLSVLEPIFKGVSDLYGNYSPYLDDMINILPVYTTDYLVIGIVAISVTTLFTIIPLLFRLKQKPMELLREEGDL